MRKKLIIIILSFTVVVMFGWNFKKNTFPNTGASPDEETLSADEKYLIENELDETAVTNENNRSYMHYMDFPYGDSIQYIDVQAFEHKNRCRV